MGKELLADLNLATFKIWLDTPPKMEMHDTNVYPTILGGVSRGFWSPFLDFGARSGGVDIWIMHFHFRASIKPNFENF